MVLVDDIFCGGFDSDGFALAAFICVGVCFLCVPLCVGGAHAVPGDADLASHGLATVRGEVLVDVHLPVCSGWCFSDPLVVLLFVIWSWPVSQLASDFGDDEDMPACLWPDESTTHLGCVFHRLIKL
jgi:hypothetical protein